VTALATLLPWYILLSGDGAAGEAVRKRELLWVRATHPFTTGYPQAPGKTFCGSAVASPIQQH